MKVTYDSEVDLLRILLSVAPIEERVRGSYHANAGNSEVGAFRRRNAASLALILPMPEVLKSGACPHVGKREFRKEPRTAKAAVRATHWHCAPTYSPRVRPA